MASEAKGSSPSLIVAFILIYAVLGPTGFVPAILYVTAVTLARTTPVLDFVLNEYESYHGARGNSRYQKLKEELSLSVRRDVTARFEIEKAELRAQIGSIDEELGSARREAGLFQIFRAKANKDIEKLEESQRDARHAIDALKLKLETVKRDLTTKKDAEKVRAAPLQFASLAASKSGTSGSINGTLKPDAASSTPSFTFGAVTPTVATVPFKFSCLSPKIPEATKTASSEVGKSQAANLPHTSLVSKNDGSNASIDNTPAPTQSQPRTPPPEDGNRVIPSFEAPPPLVKPIAPQEPISLTIKLPSQLQQLDPTRSGFRCIGRAIASHGGPCGSFSDEYLPHSRRRVAAETLKAMRSTNPSAHLFERASLKSLANDMLCIRHRSGTRHDQSGDFALDWYEGLEDAREQLRRQKDEQKFAAAPPSQMMWTQSSLAPWVFSAQPMSPASSATSVSGDDASVTMYD